MGAACCAARVLPAPPARYTPAMRRTSRRGAVPDWPLDVAVIQSLFMMLGYLTAVGIPLLIDPHQTSHILIKQARPYPHGWLSLLLTPVVGILTFATIQRRSVRLRIAGPCVVLVACVVIALPVFTPGAPNQNLLMWGFLYGLASFISCWCRFRPEDTRFVEDASVLLDLRKERLKALIELWRAMTLGLGAGYLAISLSWIHFLWDSAPNILEDKGERLELATSQGAAVAVFSVFVVFGPVRECMNGWRRATELLTSLAPDQRQASSRG